MAATVQAREKRSALATSTIAAVLIIAVAIATRFVAWWNPVAHVDDQFYLLAGEELLKGHWPYVDVWDRKPLGLFLLYAGIAWIGGGTILGLNLIATAFAAATAWMVRQIALHFASPMGATLGALAYLLVIPLVGGQTGQSPVFYNLLMSGAAWLLISSAAIDQAARIIRRALWAMVLCGLAMIIKQISFVEGIYFGLAFLWLLQRQAMRPLALMGTALLMVAVSLVPTMLTLLAYALAGPDELQAYAYACFISIFHKGGWSADTKLYGLIYFVLHLGVLTVLAVAGASRRWRLDAPQPADRLLVGWMAAAFLGYLFVPHFFDHYALPIVVPLSIAAAILFGRDDGGLFFGALAAFCLISVPIREAQGNRYARMEYERLAAEVDRARRNGCLYVADGPTRLYSTTGACQVTRYLFPDHLHLIIETGSIGVDPGAELAHILAQRPAVIVTQVRRPFRYSAQYLRFLEQVRSNYRQVYMTPADAPKLVQTVVVWQRKDLAPPQS